jgi:hypothetical protein
VLIEGFIELNFLPVPQLLPYEADALENYASALSLIKLN